MNLGWENHSHKYIAHSLWKLEHYLPIYMYIKLGLLVTGQREGGVLVDEPVLVESAQVLQEGHVHVCLRSVHRVLPVGVHG